MEVIGVDVDLKLLMILDEVYKTGSVSRAAANIGMTRPSISIALAKLRNTFNDPLFVRTSRGIEPTPHALAVIKPVREAIALLRSTLGQQVVFDPLKSTRAFRIAMADVGQVVMLPDLMTPPRGRGALSGDRHPAHLAGDAARPRIWRRRPRHRLHAAADGRLLPADASRAALRLSCAGGSSARSLQAHAHAIPRGSTHRGDHPRNWSTPGPRACVPEAADRAADRASCSRLPGGRANRRQHRSAGDRARARGRGPLAREQGQGRRVSDRSASVLGEAALARAVCRRSCQHVAPWHDIAAVLRLMCGRRPVPWEYGDTIRIYPSVPPVIVAAYPISALAGETEKSELRNCGSASVLP